MKTNGKILTSLIILTAIIATAYATPGDVITEYTTPGQCPTGLTYDGQNLWLADRLSDSLYSIDPSTGKVNQAIPAPSFIPLGLAWDGEHIWCIEGEENLLNCVDVGSGTTVNTLWLPTEQPVGLTWDGEYLWMADDRENIIARISTEDGTTITQFASPSGSPQGLAWDGRYLWCSDRIRDRIYMVDPEDGEVLLSIEAPGKYSRGLAWQDGSLWNVDYQSDRLYKLVVDDGVQYKISDPHKERLLLITEFRNYGPGAVKSLDVYIALPKDRPSQKLIQNPIFSPTPSGFVADRWDQQFAHFSGKNIPLALRQNQTMTIDAELSDARWFVFPERVGNMGDIPKGIRKQYLVDEDKYRITDPVITGAVKMALGDEKRPYWMIRKLYRLVRDKLHYELAGGWNIAPTILERGSGSCSEYSFVFIALCRAAGIPARYVGSVAVRGDDASTDDVFHRWCEIYLPGYGWVPIDPSGGDRDNPAGVAESFGHVANRYLITTEGGGASEFLGWGYNANAKWTSEGPVKIHVETIGEWSPVETSTELNLKSEGVGGEDKCRIVDE